MAILNTPVDDAHELVACNDSEGSFSSLNGANSHEAIVGPRTSTPVKGVKGLDFHMMSCDESLSLYDSVSSMSSLDSGTLTPPDFSLLTFSDVTSPVQLATDSHQVVVVEEEGQRPTAVEDSLNYRSRPGYKIVIDNIDKDVKPRDMRMDFQTKSLHYVQLYSVKDRIDFSNFSESPKDGEHCLYDILPSSDDYQKLKENLVILVARSITDNLTFFSDDFKQLVMRHVPHPYSSEMSTKSEIVSYSVSR